MTCRAKLVRLQTQSAAHSPPLNINRFDSLVAKRIFSRASPYEAVAVYRGFQLWSFLSCCIERWTPLRNAAMIQQGCF